MEQVKFLDLKEQYPLIKDQILERFEEIIENTAFVSGKHVKQFEGEFAEYIGVKHCIAVSNGTVGLYVILAIKGIGPGDEVILPVNTFIATAEAVSLLGAKPVFIDIDEKNYNLDVNQLEEKVNKNTKAIIPVHLYGQCADMDLINSFAKAHDLIVIEDACQAHGAEYKGKKAGALAEAAAFSFYPGKNLGAWGEGGAVVTNDDDLAGKIRLLRDHGSREKYRHEIVGGNFRLNEFQGAALSVKLQYLEKWNEMRRRNARIYLELLQSSGFVLPFVESHNTPVWHLFVIRTRERDALKDFLNNEGVSAGIHYPTPLHLTEAYADLRYKTGDFPVAERVQSEILSLPMYPELSKEEIEYTGGKMLLFVGKEYLEVLVRDKV